MKSFIDTIKHEAHMKGLHFSHNAKDCGELTVVQLGYVSTIAVEMVELVLTKAKEVIEEKRKNPHPEAGNDYQANRGYNQAIDDNLASLDELLINKEII